VALVGETLQQTRSFPSPSSRSAHMHTPHGVVMHALVF
jgi:hypothetical protein